MGPARLMHLAHVHTPSPNPKLLLVVVVVVAVMLARGTIAATGVSVVGSHGTVAEGAVVLAGSCMRGMVSCGQQAQGHQLGYRAPMTRGETPDMRMVTNHTLVLVIRAK
jgi:hypothetical protein